METEKGGAPDGLGNSRVRIRPRLNSARTLVMGPRRKPEHTERRVKGGRFGGHILAAEIRFRESHRNELPIPRHPRLQRQSPSINR